jgi:uncharacterized protein YndB with AHSA1/START domain
MKTRSSTHASFTLERTYPATPARVFAAFATKEAKAKWFAGPSDSVTLRWDMDFRVGGREVNIGQPEGGTKHAFEAVYWDIIPNERIVYSYDMHLNDERISVSLATIALRTEGKGTRMILTEQGAFLDGWDKPDDRERGTNYLLDALGKSLG